MIYSPEEREPVARALRKLGRYSEEEIQKEVDRCFEIAHELLKVWANHTAIGSKLASKQSRAQDQEEQHPP